MEERNTTSLVDTLSRDKIQGSLFSLGGGTGAGARKRGVWGGGDPLAKGTQGRGLWVVPVATVTVGSLEVVGMIRHC